jgi:GNAT superfamily N-acetyltransferase
MVLDHDLPNDDPNGKAVGIGYWKFYPKPRTESELDAAEKEGEEDGHPPDSNGPLLDDLHGKIAKHKREILGGQPYALLNVIATLPSYQRCGVGVMLLRWGLEQADELGLQSYLEASPMGKGLYLKNGFEEVRDVEFDALKWGLDRDLPHVCMLRPAREVNGVH